MKFGTKNSPVDNWGHGNIIAGIDLETGRLNTKGFFSPGYGTITEIHPETRIEFKGFQIPFWSDLKQRVLKSHFFLNKVFTIGWDIAITENGPIIIEANDNWGVNLFQVVGQIMKKGIKEIFDPNL